MLYNLKDQDHATKFSERVLKLMNEEAVVELKKKNQRTPNQNKYLHLLFQWFAMETGYGADYVKQRFFKKDVNGDMFIKEVEAAFPLLHANQSGVTPKSLAASTSAPA